MTIPWQIAQKLHAVTAVLEEPKVNDRAHDLVWDLQFFSDCCSMPTHADARSVHATFEARAQHPGHREPPRRTGRRSGAGALEGPPP